MGVSYWPFLDLLRAFYELGLRSICLTHVRRNAAGEGGLLVTNDNTLHDRANAVRMVGETLPASDGAMRYQHLVAWNYRTQEMTSAFARSQLRRLDDVNRSARENGEALTRRLRELPGVEPPYVPGGDSPVGSSMLVRRRPSSMDLLRTASRKPSSPPG